MKMSPIKISPIGAQRLEGLVILILALLIGFVLIPVGIVSPSNLQHISTAPWFWPAIITGGLGLTGIMMILFAGMDNSLEKEDDRDGNGYGDDDDTMDDHPHPPEGDTPWPQRLPRLLFIFGLLFAFYLSMDHLGMVVPAMVLIFTLMVYGGQRRWGLMLILSVMIPLMLYGFFVHIANIPIPLGWFEYLRGE